MQINLINKSYKNNVPNLKNRNGVKNTSLKSFAFSSDVVSFTSSQVSHPELFEIKKTALEAKKRIDDFLLNEGSLVINNASAIYKEASDEKKHVFDCLTCLKDSCFKIFAQTPWGTRLQKTIHADEKSSAVLIEEFDAEGKLIKQMMLSGNNPVRTLKITDEQIDVFDFFGNQSEFVVTKNVQLNSDMTEDCDGVYVLKSDADSMILLNSVPETDSSEFEKRIILRNLEGNIKSVEFKVKLNDNNVSSSEDRYTFDYKQGLIHYFKNYSSQKSSNISWEECYSYEKDSFHSLIKKGTKPLDVASAIEAQEAIYKNSSGKFIKKCNPRCKFFDYKLPQFLN
ncbi:MAG: hypothetical protein IKU37_05135 [Candidatus Gastranaerophilales bacterium]|nr:hypothetical protein [Candidatus Gastranaerophilales bacterium]